jgi:hypothetical protein
MEMTEVTEGHGREPETLSVPSDYHKLSILFEPGVLDMYKAQTKTPTVSGGQATPTPLATFDDDSLDPPFANVAPTPGGERYVESMYAFLPIRDSARPTPFARWDFDADHPFPTRTNTPTSGGPATPTPTISPTPTEGIASTPTAYNEIWHYRSYVSTDGDTIPASQFISLNGSDEVEFRGDGLGGVCNYSIPYNNRECCNNLENYPDPTPTPPGAAAVPTNPPGIAARATETCSFRNHECNPVCEIDNFEGAEMWKRISTEGYKNVVVQFDLKGEGLSDIPHGRIPRGGPWDGPNSVRTEAILGRPANAYKPYIICDMPDENVDCVDGRLLEECFEVFFTADYDEPYDEDLIPNFFIDDQTEEVFGIHRWQLATFVTREVLLEDYGGSGGPVTLDFSMHDVTDDNPDFGIWFRSQLDAQENRVIIDNITVRGEAVQ